MKHIVNFNKLYETGECNKKIDWNHVKNNPNDNNEESDMINYLEKKLRKIKHKLIDPKIFKIINIKVFDMYQGPYAIVKLFLKNYYVWTIGYNDLWIKNFPIDNTGSDESESGYKGNVLEIIDLLNNIIQCGGIEEYLDTKKYNL
jgi:hypothetical protein